MNNNISKETAKILIKIGAVSFRFNPPFTFTSGLKSPIYLDNRIIMSHPKERRQIINFYIKIIKEKVHLDNVDCVSATASAAIPHGAWIAGKLNLPMVYVRPTTKSYGKGNKIEGYLKKGSRVVVIEDHISTAASVLNNASTIRKNGGKVKFCIATTTYETEISKKNLAKAKVKLFTLTTGKTIIKEAYKEGVLDKKEKKEIDRWFTNPSLWWKETPH